MSGIFRSVVSDVTHASQMICLCRNRVLQFRSQRFLQSISSSYSEGTTNNASLCWTDRRLYSNLSNHSNVSINDVNVWSDCLQSYEEGRIPLFLQNLKDDIRATCGNKKRMGDMIGLFRVIKLDGPDVVLQRTFKTERITVKFNVNNSIQKIDYLEEEISNYVDADKDELVCRPSFFVEVDRGCDKRIAYSCCKLQPTDEFVRRAAENPFEIENVAVLRSGQEWNHEVLPVAGILLEDHKKYGMVEKILDERGVNLEFAISLEKWCTAYVHQRNIELLEQIYGMYISGRVGNVFEEKNC